MFSMFSCRGSAALRAACGRSRPAVQRRLMSSGSGGSGTNIMYAVLCGGGLVGSVSYAYSIVSSDQTRYNQRLAEIRARPKTEWVPKPWPPKSQDEEEGGEEEEEVEPEAEVTETEEEVVE
ncbi:protein MGARP, partial [Gouania willdenowi]|uniref:protein MGARP n=1 Tax=Gouania willdenowi TaxID=441366 RepID=UPI00105431D9